MRDCSRKVPKAHCNWDRVDVTALLLARFYESRASDRRLISRIGCGLSRANFVAPWLVTSISWHGETYQCPSFRMLAASGRLMLPARQSRNRHRHEASKNGGRWRVWVSQARSILETTPNLTSRIDFTYFPADRRRRESLFVTNRSQQSAVEKVAVRCDGATVFLNE